MRYKEVQFSAGESIQSAINHLLERAEYEKKWNFNVFGIFNGIKLEIKDDNANYDSIYNYYQEQRTIQELKYLEEHKEERLAREKEVALIQNQLNALSFKFMNSDLNQQEIVDLLFEIQPLSDNIGAYVNLEIVGKLKRLGYYANMCLCSSPMFYNQSLDFQQKYLIGQAMDQLIHIGAIHPSYQVFYEKIHKKN